MKFKFVLTLLAVLAIPAAAGAFNSRALIPDFLPNEQYNESWYFYFQFDQGYRVFSTVMVTNLGPGDKRPSFNCTVVSPGGKAQLYQGRHDPEELTVTESPARLDMKTSYLAAEGSNLRYHLAESGATIDLTITPLVEGKTKMERSKFGADAGDFYEMQVPIARGKVSGSITVGGKKVDVTGTGYFEHSRSNVTVLMYSKKAMRLVIWDKDKTVSAMLVKPEEGVRIARAFCIADSSSTTQNNITIEESATGAALPGWKVSACNETITVTAEKLIQKMNLFDNLSLLEKAAMGLTVGNPTTERYQIKGGGFFERIDSE